MKMTDEERMALIEKAEKERDNAPKMDADSARTLHRKWKTDERSYSASMVKEVKNN